MNKKFIVLFTIIVLLSVTIVSSINLIQTADAAKSKGTQTKKFGSDTKSKVCGDKLCSEMTPSEKESKDTKHHKNNEMKHHEQKGTLSPWAGEQTREIKSLSARELEGLQKGHGVGMALLAELNSYPGPRHVLDLAEELSLTQEQQNLIDQFYEEMEEQSIPLSLQFIEIEREMNQKFIEKSITSEELTDLVQKNGETHWKLRNVHLQAHLKTVDVLNSEQIELYNQLRGYS